VTPLNVALNRGDGLRRSIEESKNRRKTKARLAPVRQPDT
jgi:hypothetical protein